MSNNNLQPNLITFFFESFYRRCFVKTIQMAVSQRLLPLRCVICRAKILRLKQTLIPRDVSSTNNEHCFLLVLTISPSTYLLYLLIYHLPTYYLFIYYLLTYHLPTYYLFIYYLLTYHLPTYLGTSHPRRRTPNDMLCFTIISWCNLFTLSFIKTYATRIKRSPCSPMWLQGCKIVVNWSELGKHSSPC